jgi:quinohemoprotein ethanol dehydrogenase
MQTPGALGGHNWQPMAYSPNERLVYIPAQIAQGAYADPGEFHFTPGAWNTAMRRGPPRPGDPEMKVKLGEPDKPRARGELLAWDPVAQNVRWSAPFEQPWRSGVLATGGGLVFHAAGREFIAFDAATGRRLWAFDTGANPIAAASSYAIDGEQYVALMVGYGGAGGMGGDEHRRPGRLLVFKLDGNTTAKPYAEPAAPGPLDLKAATPAKGDKRHGEALYGQFCAQCHGRGAFLPDLARSPAILDPAGFQAIVIGGALKPHGMAPFKRFFDEAGAEDLRAFLLDEARKAPTPVAADPQHAQ